MRSRKRLLQAVVAMLAISAMTGLVVMEVRQAWGACSITWLAQDDCLVALSSPVDGVFGDSLSTTVGSQQSQWTLYMAYTPGNSENISNGAPSPNTTETITTSTNVDRNISGQLSEPTEPGIFQFSAWDGTHFQCADAFDIDIKRSGGSCDDD